jgi:hypothetical protein
VFLARASSAFSKSEVDEDETADTDMIGLPSESQELDLRPIGTCGEEFQRILNLSLSRPRTPNKSTC